MLREEKGITLVALIITIIILVILAAVTIITLRNTNMIEYAMDGTQKYQQAQIDEESIVQDLDRTVSSALYVMSSVNSDYLAGVAWREEIAKGGKTQTQYDALDATKQAEYKAYWTAAGRTHDPEINFGS